VAKESYLLMMPEHFAKATKPEAERVINPTQQGPKRVIKTTPQGGRKKNAKSHSARETPAKRAFSASYC